MSIWCGLVSIASWSMGIPNDSRSATECAVSVLLDVEGTKQVGSRMIIGSTDMVDESEIVIGFSLSRSIAVVNVDHY